MDYRVYHAALNFASMTHCAIGFRKLGAYRKKEVGTVLLPLVDVACPRIRGAAGSKTYQERTA